MGTGLPGTKRSDSGNMTQSMHVAPSAQQLAAWSRAYIESSVLTHKLAPPPFTEAGAEALGLPPPQGPGRPTELRVTWAKYKAPRSAHALMDVRKRAHLLHTFFHHELQAAELLCWAVLRFPDAPLAFRRGLLNICLDEIRHMNAYAQRLRELGFPLGSFEVRDWFWERAPAASTPAAFVALMGLGFEAGNLDHARRFAQMLREAGDAASATLQEQVGDEEVAHVAFGAHWFRELTGGLGFAAWCSALPPPLSPMVMRGSPLDRPRRAQAGFPADFLDALEAWVPESRGC
ncbi:MAG: hypothetical protein RL385_3984 [Pseudomonadota bacterium]